MKTHLGTSWTKGVRDIYGDSNFLEANVIITIFGTNIVFIGLMISDKYLMTVC